MLVLSSWANYKLRNSLLGIMSAPVAYLLEEIRFIDRTFSRIVLELKSFLGLELVRLNLNNTGNSQVSCCFDSRV